MGCSDFGCHGQQQQQQLLLLLLPLVLLLLPILLLLLLLLLLMHLFCALSRRADPSLSGASLVKEGIHPEMLNYKCTYVAIAI